MAKAYLIDTTKCVGCRSCQVSCKQWNNLPAEKTALQPKDRGLQNPTVLSAKTFTVVTYSEVADDRAPGGLKYIFAKRQCMHCNDPACATACPVTALHKTKEGPVTYDSEKCIGCRYCVMACPFGVPTAEWDSRAPKIRKCTMCYDRISGGGVPACVKACPSAAITFGDRDQLIAMAKKRIEASPGKYVNRIYGEKEAGGTGVLYMSSVPFEQIGFTEVGTASFAEHSNLALEAVPHAVVGVGAVLGSLAWIVHRRKQEMARQGMTQQQIDAEFAPMQPAVSKPALAAITKAPVQSKHDAGPHVEFAPIQAQLWTPFNKLLLVVMAFGAISFLLRFALGLGGSTNLSDTHAWGLWIVFDLVWIAAAAGAFATAGLIYVFRRRDLYPLGRSAVLMGLLSYTFVAVTLVADLGVPWHAWQLLFQAPAHSAMFEVSWCIGLYVTILAFEFLPIPCERWGIPRAMEFWRKYSNVYVVFAVTVFVYLLSRKVLWATAACALFAMLAYKFRPREGEKPVPVMLALAAVVFSTMHQSSLGSLFLLMSDKLNHLWWSPIMPIYFFLSAVAAGTAMVVLLEMWIARAYRRALPMQQLISMGQISFWALLAYEVVRLGDIVQRGQLALLRGNAGGLFATEVLLGGLVPLALLSSTRLRQRPRILMTGAGLAVAGVVLDRMNVVLFAMDLKGPMPQIAPMNSSPSLVEWGISAGLCAATIFMFGYVAQLGSVAYAAYQRKLQAAKEGVSPEVEQLLPARPPAQPARRQPRPGEHAEFAPLGEKFWTPLNKVLLILMSLGAISYLLRFALGLGAVTNLSDTHAWGLWIMLNLIDIAGAAGAFAVAALIYIFRREDLYPLGRSAVLLGFLTYTSVAITLMADVGLPWHIWQLLVQTPLHSAMFEVSWCISLYVTILAFEFLPIPFGALGLQRSLDLWRKYSNLYVVLAVTVFAYLMSHTLAWAVLAFAVFALLAWIFRPREGEQPVPVMLALAGAVFSTLHQSSLGSLFLLMSDKLSHLWWSPILPVNFFLSAVAAGTALVVITEIWIAKAYRRPLPMPQLSLLGKISFWTLAAYEVVRLMDLVQRGQLPAAVRGTSGVLFMTEVLLGGVLPLALLCSERMRRGPLTLGLGVIFTLAGVIFDRMNVVILGMDLKGPMPQIAPAHYTPSIFEWSMAMGASAATIFAFGYAARRLPILTKEATAGD